MTLTNIAKQHRSQDQAMRSAHQHYAQVHSEIEYPEYERLCEGENDDAGEFGECNSGENLRNKKRCLVTNI